MECCGVRDHGCRGMKHTNPNPNPGNNPKQTTNNPAGQAESQRSGLPRPKRSTGKSGRDPIDYGEHPYPSMKCFAQHLVLSHPATAGGAPGPPTTGRCALSTSTSAVIRRVSARSSCPVCHPAARDKRELVAFHTGRPLLVGPFRAQAPKPAVPRPRPCCGSPMKPVLAVPPAWQNGRAPPTQRQCA